MTIDEIPGEIPGLLYVLYTECNMFCAWSCTC
uniref:Uncharacterized protein n=1 Tax=Anguilla anguilla TaxID=7936 RepID=A0A0E9S960_ANGAN